MERDSPVSSDASEHSLEATTSDSELSSEQAQDLPFRQRIEEKQTGQTTRSTFFGRAQGKTLYKTKDKSKASAPKVSTRVKFKRENKNRPAEQSSKRPVPRFRDVVEGQSRRSLDPRFDDLAGKFRDETFKRRYSFLFDEQLPQEKSHLKKQMKSTKSTARKQQLQADLSRIEQQIKAESEKRKKQAAESLAMAKEKQAVKAGKRPFFLKKSEKKKQELIRRYHELKATGRLEKALTKKRRKNAAKDHRYMPEAQ